MQGEPTHVLQTQMQFAWGRCFDWNPTDVKRPLCRKAWYTWQELEVWCTSDCSSGGVTHSSVVTWSPRDLDFRRRFLTLKGNKEIVKLKAVLPLGYWHYYNYYYYYYYHYYYYYYYHCYYCYHYHDLYHHHHRQSWKTFINKTITSEMRSLLCLWGRLYIFLSLSRSLSISNSLCLSIFISISVTWSAVARHRRLLMIFMEPSFAPWWSGTKLSLSAINPVKRRLHMDRRSKGSNQKVHVKHIHCP